MRSAVPPAHHPFECALLGWVVFYAQCWVKIGDLTQSTEKPVSECHNHTESYTASIRWNADLTLFFKSRVTGEFTDKPIRGQLSCGVVNLQTSQFAKMFDFLFAINNCYKCNLWQFTLLNSFKFSIVDRLRVRVIFMFGVQIQYSLVVIYNKFAVGELTSLRLD